LPVIHRKGITRGPICWGRAAAWRIAAEVKFIVDLVANEVAAYDANELPKEVLLFGTATTPGKVVLFMTESQHACTTGNP
jgi:hypothetical protein